MVISPNEIVRACGILKFAERKGLIAGWEPAPPSGLGGQSALAIDRDGGRAPYAGETRGPCIPEDVDKEIPEPGSSRTGRPGTPCGSCPPNILGVNARP